MKNNYDTIIKNVESIIRVKESQNNFYENIISNLMLLSSTYEVKIVKLMGYEEGNKFIKDTQLSIWNKIYNEVHYE